MTPTDILLIVEPGRDARAAAGVAAALGRQFGGRIEGLCLTPLPELQTEDCYATGPTAIHDVTVRLEQETQAFAATAEASVLEAIRPSGCELTWTVGEPGELAARTALRCRLHDLVVMNKPADRDTGLAEAVLRLGGAPCLVVPQDWDPARRLDHMVVAWNGSHQAKRALDDAMELLRQAKTVSILTVGEEAIPEGEQAALIAHLARKGVPATMAVVPKEARGPAILAWCREHAADLLVMGAFGHTPRTERWFGGTTWTVLTGAQTPVLMSC
jgi:nucleotide-binding universal stress UspA family protein